MLSAVLWLPRPVSTKPRTRCVTQACFSPLEGYSLPAVLAEVAEFDELAPRDDLVSGVLRPNHRWVTDPGCLVAVEPRARPIRSQTQQAGGLGDPVHRALENRHVRRAHNDTMPQGCTRVDAHSAIPQSHPGFVHGTKTQRQLTGGDAASAGARRSDDRAQP